MRADLDSTGCDGRDTYALDHCDGLNHKVLPAGLHPDSYQMSVIEYT